MKGSRRRLTDIHRQDGRPLRRRVNVHNRNRIGARRFVLHVRHRQNQNTRTRRIGLPNLGRRVSNTTSRIQIRHLTNAIRQNGHTTRGLLHMDLEVIVHLSHATSVHHTANRTLNRLRLRFQMAASTRQTTRAISNQLTSLQNLNRNNSTRPHNLLQVRRSRFNSFTLNLIRIFGTVLSLFRRVSRTIREYSLDRRHGSTLYCTGETFSTTHRNNLSC